ncbi:GTPase Obg [Clostridia bacterium]|nr:GTPase Obg [Clostridia bacterium]
MFIDKVEIEIKAGSGGNGCVAFHREKFVARGGPDGGDGGHGGSIIFRVDTNKNTLLDFKYRRKFKAESGIDGKTSKMWGKSADDLIIPVPPGTIIRDALTALIIKDMGTDGDFLAARGGKGGWGNRHFATPSRQTPNFAKNGLPGEEKKLILELKTLADVGLIGYPSVGKSSILDVVSLAKPKIAAFHFTTLSPNLGVVTVSDDFGFVMADIPGLIEGASEGKGLGHDFLRHIERCRLLVHVVDISAEEGRDPIGDIEDINRELAKFSDDLTDRPQIIAANKVDLTEGYETFLETGKLSGNEAFEEYAKSIGCEVVYISAAANKGIDRLIEKITETLPTLPPVKIYESEVAKEVYIAPKDERNVEITQEKDVFFAEAEWLFKVTNSVNFEDRESTMYFQRVLNKNGVIDALRKAGAKEGSSVNIYGVEFDFVD